ncbi:MAG: hypothetical protein H7A25_05265 [Leptospiraceae bacterium]|nr:hypothetical protein [Leptospiraceae bacterium]
MFLFYKAIFNSYTAKQLVLFIFPKVSTGKISLEVQQFSLFYGLDIRNIKIISNQDFDNETFFEADRLALLYRLPSVFWGRLEVDGLFLIRPRILLHKKKEIWNFESLFPSEPSTEKKEEKKDKQTPEDNKEISTFISVSTLLHILIDDLHFQMKIEGKEPVELKAFPIYLETLLETKESSKIPKDLSALELIKRFFLRLNPSKKLDLSFQDKTYTIKEKLDINLIFEKEEAKDKKLKLLSSLKLGGENIQIQVKGKKAYPLTALASYSLNYSPSQDTLSLNDLSLVFQKNPWLRVKGNLNHVLKDTREFDAEVFESDINLDVLSSFLSGLPGMELPIGGNLKLLPVKAKGPLSDLNLNLELKGKNVFYGSGKQRHSVPSLHLKADGVFDFVSKKEGTAKDPLPFMKKLNIEDLSLYYNQIFLSLNGFIRDTDGIQLGLQVKNVNLGAFTSAVSGVTAARLQVKAKDFSLLNARLQAGLAGFRYSIGKSKSPIGSIDLDLNAAISFLKGFKPDTLQIHSIQIPYKNSAGKQALGLSLQKGSIQFPGELSIKADNLSLQTHIKNLLSALPLSLKETISPLRSIIGDKQVLELKSFQYKLGKEKDIIGGNLLLQIPALALNDLESRIRISLSKNYTKAIHIQSFQITALNQKLTGEIEGKLFKNPAEKKAPLGDFFPDLRISFKLDAPDMIRLIKNVNFKGNYEANFELKDFLIKGLIKIEKSILHVMIGDCEGKNSCDKYELEAIELKLPIEHNLALDGHKSLIEGNKSRYVKTYGKTPEDNFKIGAIYGPHISNKKKRFPFVAGQIEGEPGLSARIDYRANYFSMDNLRIRMLDGIVYGKDILFNVGTAEPLHMEYSATLQVKDIDLKKLLPDNIQNRFDDGKIKADVNLSGKNLTDPLGNLELFFSVYQIGKDFGKSAINVVSPQNRFTDFLIGSYSVDKLEVELSKGLVYAKILFKRSILSSIISIEDNKISQERVPLANFLNRAKSEISSYQ